MNIVPVIKRSKRARQIRISIQRGHVILTLPTRLPLALGKKFFESKRDWVSGVLSRIANQPSAPWTGSTKEYHSHRARAKKMIVGRVKSWASLHGFTYTSISVKNQLSKWGSCSKARKLNFNYRLYFLPTELVDYVVVHELCHLRQMNHGKLFWGLVRSIIPEYNRHRHSLRQYHL